MSKKISLWLAVVLAVVLVVVTFMATFTGVSLHYRNVVNEAYLEGAHSQENDAMLSKLSAAIGLYQTHSVYEWDEEKALDNMIQAYADSMGDDYADYYNAEEFAELTANNNAQAVGIGINIIPTEAVDGLEVILVNQGSPAEEAGIQIGDIVTSVLVDGVEKTVVELGYNGAVEAVRGEEGTEVTLWILRQGEKLKITAERKAVTTVSVMSWVCATDSTVGVVRMTGFDTKTPLQFDAAMDGLIAKGCTKFVFDMRHNGGGDLQSVKAVLARFLKEGDIILRTVYNNNVEQKTVVEEYLPEERNDYFGCTVTKADMGKYREYQMAVLAGPNTASAAELFTSCLKDYELAVVVGEVTFGKGIMQSIIPLSGSSKGYTFGGAVKMTSAYYYPPFSDNFHGIGVIPDVEVSLNEALLTKNYYRVTDAEDNQLQTAIGQFR